MHGCGHGASCCSRRPAAEKVSLPRRLGRKSGRPTLILDIGALMGSLVGQTERNIRQALRIVDAMAPAVAFLDECEKAFAGTASQGDSGVSARLFGTFLSWLNDRESDTFVVATANDISRLPPEFSRAERFDGVFFLDLPGREQRQAIWRLYLAKYQLDAAQKLPPDDDWTGAEIKSCCRLAALLDVPLVAAAQNIVPVAKTSAEAVDKLRTWASGRCLSADAARHLSAAGGVLATAPGVARSFEQLTQQARRRYAASHSPSHFLSGDDSMMRVVVLVLR